MELFAAIEEKLDDALTCQLYATMPLGSVTADHEMVSGAVTLAPEAGESGLGVGGVAADASRGNVNSRHNARMYIKREGRFFMTYLRVFPKGRRSSARDRA